MSSIIIAFALNVACFLTAYFMLPYANALEFLGMVILLPIIYNVFLITKTKLLNNSKLLTMLLYSGMTTLAYIVLGFVGTHTGFIQEFAVRNSYSDGNVTVSISENIDSVSNIIFILLLQFCVMYFVKYMKDRQNHHREQYSC